MLLLILLAVVGKWTWSVQSRLSKPQPGHHAFPFFAKEKERCPVVYAHRANTGRYPENSLESFLDAAKAGSDVLETDLRLTQDGVLIPFHDSSMQRMMGQSGGVEDYTLADLQQWPLRQHNKEAIIPSFAEVVEALPLSRFNVEIKENKEAVVRALWDFINAHELHDRIQVSSFHHDVLVAFRRLSNNRIPTGASPQEVVEFLLLWLLGQESPMEFASLQLPYGGNKWLDKRVLAMLKKESGPRIQVFTINSFEQIEPLLGNRRFGVMTDTPVALIEKKDQRCKE
ncbi:MAG: glycerophosphodiester phosphodiesterase family protein [Myxococcota bacterium]|nr:glycerophosphodiester phosphodiesterase family protein [Myxococcota bacterium]